MTIVRSSTQTSASPEEVWAELADFQSHSEWMQDAVAIRFVGEQTTGVGTAFDCETKVGPIRLTDRITVTGWNPPHRMDVTHGGIVSGTGSFECEATSGGTTLVWTEELHFPIYMAGPLGEAVAKPIFKHMWANNLKRLKQRIEA
jgi:hypothetical protein